MKSIAQRALQSALVAIVAMTLVACGTNAENGDAPVGGDDSSQINLLRSEMPGGVVAYVDGVPITFNEMMSEAQAELNQIEIQRFRTLQSTIDRITARRLVERAAAADGIGPEAWLAREVDKRVPQPSEARIAELMKRYEKHPSMIGKSTQERRDMVRQEATRDKVRDAHIEIFELLRAGVEIESFLDPPRVDIDVPDSAPSWGPTDAPVTVVEFSDYQCKFCRQTHGAVQQLLTEFGDRVRFVYRDFAAAERPRAEPAARAARCAGEQSRYRDYHDVLWSKDGDLSDDDLLRRAEGLALNMKDFRDCYSSDRYDAEIARSFEEGRKLGVTGTPTFFINGLVLQGSQTFESLKVVVEDELKRVGGA